MQFMFLTIVIKDMHVFTHVLYVRTYLFANSGFNCFAVDPKTQSHVDRGTTDMRSQILWDRSSNSG